MLPTSGRRCDVVTQAETKLILCGSLWLAFVALCGYLRGSFVAIFLPFVAAGFATRRRAAAAARRIPCCTRSPPRPRGHARRRAPGVESRCRVRVQQGRQETPTPLRPT